MGRHTIDIERRTFLQGVAGGLTATGHLPVRTDGGRRSPGPTGTGAPPGGVGFVVARDGEQTLVFRRDADGPVFEGSPGAAVQHAVDAGRQSGTGTVVAVAPGTYDLERPVTLAPSTWLVGSGTATTLRAAPGLDADLLTVPGGAEHVHVSDLRLDGHRAANERGDALVVVGDAWRPVLERLVVRNATDHGVRFTGGPEGEYTYEPALTDVDVARCGGDGFVFGYTGDLFGANLYAEACEGHGFTLADAGGTLVHPHAYDTKGSAGVRVLGAAEDLTLFGLHAERNRQRGILVEGTRIAVANAFVANNSRDASGTDSGLVLSGATDCLVADSTFVNAADRDPTQRCGIAETDPSPNTLVRHNVFRDNRVAAVERAGSESGLWCVGNRGYRTANGGRTTVADDGSIEHGLVERPEEYRVQTTASGTYAHAVDADDTAITVEVVRLDANTGTEPVSDPVTVTWSARTR